MPKMFSCIDLIKILYHFALRPPLKYSYHKVWLYCYIGQMCVAIWLNIVRIQGMFGMQDPHSPNFINLIDL